MTYTAKAVSHGLEIEGAQQWHDLPVSARPGGDLFGHLLAATPGLPPGLYTDVWSGPVTVDLEWVESTPTAVQLEDFDIVVETSIWATGGPLALRGFEDSPSLASDHGLRVPAGWLRLRVCTRGRGVASDEAVSTPVEYYLLQAWTAPPSPTINLTTGDRVRHHDPVATAAPGAAVTPEPNPSPPSATS